MDYIIWLLCADKKATPVSESACYTTLPFLVTERNPRKIFAFTKKAVTILMIGLSLKKKKWHNWNFQEVGICFALCSFGL